MPRQFLSLLCACPATTSRPSASCTAPPARPCPHAPLPLPAPCHLRLRQLCLAGLVLWSPTSGAGARRVEARWPWVTVVECLQLAIVRKKNCSAQACRRDHLDKQRVSASLIPSPSNPSQCMHKTKSISNCSGECLDRSEGKHSCGWRRQQRGRPARQHPEVGARRVGELELGLGHHGGGVRVVVVVFHGVIVGGRRVAIEGAQWGAASVQRGSGWLAWRRRRT